MRKRLPVNHASLFVFITWVDNTAIVAKKANTTRIMRKLVPKVLFVDGSDRSRRLFSDAGAVEALSI